MTCGFLIQLVFCQRKNYVVYWCWSRARDECTSSLKKNPGSAPVAFSEHEVLSIDGQFFTLTAFFNLKVNGPYAWLHHTSKFHLASSERTILCICTCGAWLFYSTLLPWEYIYLKLCNLTISKWGLVVEFARLT